MLIKIAFALIILLMGFFAVILRFYPEFLDKMHEQLVNLGLILLTLLLGFWAVMLTINWTKEAGAGRRLMEEFAKEHGLRYEKPGPISDARASGSYRGREMECHFEAASKGSPACFHVEMKPNRPEDNFFLAISHGQPFSILKAVGLSQTVKLGNPKFDSGYQVKTNDQPKARSLLNIDAQMEVDEGMRSLSLNSVSFGDGELWTDGPSSMAKEDLEKCAEFFTRLCERLEKI